MTPYSAPPCLRRPPRPPPPSSTHHTTTCRMPLAYVQLVQILTDGLILTTPFALIHSVGPFGVVMGTAVVTLFHSPLRWLKVASRWLAP